MWNCVESGTCSVEQYAGDICWKCVIFLKAALGKSSGEQACLIDCAGCPLCSLEVLRAKYAFGAQSLVSYLYLMSLAVWGNKVKGKHVFFPGYGQEINRLRSATDFPLETLHAFHENF